VAASWLANSKRVIVSDKRFDASKIDQLRSPERLELLEVNSVVDFCLEDQAIKSILDAGTGSGVFAEAFHSHGLRVEGVDVNAEMIAACTEILPSIPFKIAQTEDLPYEDNSFDMVFFGMVLHETDNPLKSLQEAHRVARKQVVVLEWLHKAQSFGPPLTDRLSKEEIQRLANLAGLQDGAVIYLKNLCLYKFSC
jgi:ubiquinone/menaquinone biosynthesis C-methylase UbiE